MRRKANCQRGQGSLPGYPLLRLWAFWEGLRPPCLVPSLTSLTYHFHRRRGGARKVRRYMRRHVRRLP